jgi:hypothetical protein
MLCTFVNNKFPILTLMYNNSITLVAIRLSIVWGSTAAPAEVRNENHYLIQKQYSVYRSYPRRMRRLVFGIEWSHLSESPLLPTTLLSWLSYNE